jgi:hypothetical protein
MFLRGLMLLLIPAVLLAGCGSSDDDAAAEPPATSFATAESNQIGVHMDDDAHGHSGTAEAGEAMQVVLVPSELVVGPNRFAVGLLTPDNAVIGDAQVRLQYFDLSDAASPREETSAAATRVASPDGMTVIYTHEREFARAGAWGVRVEARLPDGTTLDRNIRFEVQADSDAVLPGEPAPASDSPTAVETGGDLTTLTSAPDPNPAFYTTSIAGAVASGRPTLLLFATPSFCQTRFCGPDYEIASDLQSRYGDRMNFVHVEVYTGLPNPAANGWQITPSMGDFGLRSEPWLYLIDAAGIVTYRVEGLFTEPEIERQIDALLGG